jgi:isopentenyl-diphosphate delta-isomerase
MLISLSKMKMSDTSKRKQEHIRICLEKDVESKTTNGFELYRLEHKALPEISLSDIDASTMFFGKKFSVPFFIEPLTGGTPEAEGINKNLARAAEKLGIGMGLGSQRAMLENPNLSYTYQVRDVAPSIFLLGNIGASSLSEVNLEKIGDLVRVIGADGLAVHLNPAHELCQPEGNTDWSHILKRIEVICENAVFPVVVKETGCGISGDVAQKLASAGVDCLDIGGMGGTSMMKVEYFRGFKDAAVFFEWGIQTAESLRQCRQSVGIPLIASGGIRTGLDCAKALAMGASLVGFALPVLRAAAISEKKVIEHIESLEWDLKRTMLLVGARNIDELKKTKVIKLRESELLHIQRRSL